MRREKAKKKNTHCSKPLARTARSRHPTNARGAHSKECSERRKRRMYAQRRYSARLYDELCVQCVKLDMDRNPYDYIR